MRSLAMLACLAATTALAQDATLPVYTATQLRLNTDAANRRTRTTPDGFQMVGMTIRTIWQLAYPSQAGDPVGAPDWFSTDRYDLTVRFEGTPTSEQRMLAMRQIFAEQLKLKVHRETRDLPTYDLVVSRPDRRLGPSLRRIDIDCDALRTSMRAAVQRGEPVTQPPPATNGAPLCGEKLGAGSVMSGGMPIANLASFFRNVAGRLIVDKTGLDGFYEYALEWAPGGAPSPDAAPDPRPTLFTALQERLGLKLEPSVTPIEVVVIDHIERPTGRPQ